MNTTVTVTMIELRAEPTMTVVHGPQNLDRQQHAGSTPNELGEDIKHGVDRFHLAQAQECEGDGRIDVRAGALAPRRVDDADGGEPHGESHQCAPQVRIGDRPVNGGAGVLEGGGKESRRDHEGAEPPGFHEVLRPMLAECAFDAECLRRHPQPPVSKPG